MSYYHLSRNLIEDDFIYPKLGKVAQSEYWLKRVCAAPTIEQALKAIGNIHEETVYIYQIDEEPDREATGVYDAHLTGEVWYFHPVRFTFIGTTNEYAFPYQPCTCGTCQDGIAYDCC